jgi:integrase
MTATVGDLFDAVESHRASVGRSSPRTLYNDRRRFDRDVRPTLGDKRQRRVTPQALDALYADLANAGMNPPSVFAVHVLLKGLWTQAQKWGWPTHDNANPTKSATPPKVTPFEYELLEVADVRKLIAEAERVNYQNRSHPDLASLIFFAARSGMRQGELCALRFSDVVAKTGTVHVHASVWEVGLKTRDTYQWGIKSTKSGKARKFTIDPEAVAVLARQWDRLVAVADELGVPAPADAYVWSPDELGQVPYMPRYISHLFGDVRKRADVSCRFHDLRAFHATELLAAGVDLKTVQERLGHATPLMTLNLYAKVRTASDVNAAAVIGARLSGLTLALPAAS